MNDQPQTDVHYVPALAGFDVLTLLPDDKAFDADPVAAWAVLTSEDGLTIAMPVTVRPMNLDDDPVVRLPTGEVVYGDYRWMTDAEWLADALAGTKPVNITINNSGQMPGVLSLDNFRRKMQAE